ncbi:MAG: transposase [Elusimicrobiota bacterium]
MDRDWKGIHGWQWLPVKDLLPPNAKPFRRRLRKGGRPRADDRKCFEAILWSARTGLPWRQLPARFGKPRTSSRRLAQWHRSGRPERLWMRYLQWTGPTERNDWRRRLDTVCGCSPEYRRLEFQVILNLEYGDRNE